MWNQLRQRCLIVIPLLCVLSFGLANALHGYANAEGQPPDMLATLPGQLKFVHVVRVSLVLVESPAISVLCSVDISPRRQNARGSVSHGSLG